MTDELARLREAVRSARNYAPDLDVERDVHPLLARGAHAEVVALVSGLMPGAYLSPSAHTILAAAHEALGAADLARREQRVARMALASILDSGDGTAERPWRVLRVSDEYDVLRSQGRRSVEQRFLTRDGIDLDRHRCADGSEAWFDVSLLGIRTA
ncbi:hypothetical protein GCM10027062_12950 [Nocardioides hungaricus]